MAITNTPNKHSHSATYNYSTPTIQSTTTPKPTGTARGNQPNTTAKIIQVLSPTSPTTTTLPILTQMYLKDYTNIRKQKIKNSNKYGIRKKHYNHSRSSGTISPRRITWIRVPWLTICLFPISTTRTPVTITMLIRMVPSNSKYMTRIRSCRKKLSIAIKISNKNLTSSIM